MKKIQDLTGQQFGYLTVLEYKGIINGNSSWLCKCDCGKEVIIIGSRLKSGNTKSCGCHRYDGLKQYNKRQSQEQAIPIGTVFGRLTVIEDIGLKPAYNGANKNRRWYKCQCSCGNIVEYNGNSLKNGDRVSCGCISSKGERKILDILVDNHIIFEHDSELKQLTQETGRRLRFDFIIYNKDMSINRCIEFDGRQHKDGMDGGIWSHSETYEVIHERDLIKNTFCINHNIPLIRIPYDKLNQITFDNLFDDTFLVKE